MPLDKSLTAKDIYQMVIGYQHSQIMYTACALGLFEVIHKSSVPVTSEAAANMMQTEAEATERFLNACAGLDLVEVQVDSNGIVTFQNSPATEKYLISSSAMSMKPLCLMQGDFYKVWGRLPAAITDGTSQMPLVMGTASDMFKRGSGFCVNEEKQSDFLQCMHMFSRMDSPHVLDAFDLSEFDTVCDLGGGTGALAFEIALRYRESDVTVMDLSHVVAMAKQFLPKSQPKNLKFVSGDFFSDTLPRADLYILSHVIHDWDENKINMLLSKVYATLKPGGGILICEKMLRALKTGPLNTLLFDLGMLLVSEGKERTASEYESLLARSAFTDIQNKELPDLCFRDVIFARKFQL